MSTRQAKLLLVALMITSSALALTYKFENTKVESVLKMYAEATGKRIDLVQGEHPPITLVAYDVTIETMLEQIEHALKEQNLKLYKISEDHLVASWIEVPEQKDEYPKRRRILQNKICPNQVTLRDDPHGQN